MKAYVWRRSIVTVILNVGTKQGWWLISHSSSFTCSKEPDIRYVEGLVGPKTLWVFQKENISRPCWYTKPVPPSQ